MSVQEGIDSARRIFKHCWFDSDKCERGIDALASYHKEYDEKNMVARNTPKHDWASNSSDAFRYFAVTYETMVEPERSVSFEVDYS